jgi:peptide/nickel transport system substrate-binding protein
MLSPTITAARRRRRLPTLVFATAATVVTLLSSCAGTSAEEDGPSSLTIALPGVPGGDWSPLNGVLLFGLGTGDTAYESLIVFDSTELEYKPWLAEEFAISDDRRTFSVVLRDDVDFTDGVHLDAEAFKTGWDALEAAGSQYSFFEFAAFSPEVTVTGEYSLEIRTSSGISDRFLDALTYLPTVSPAAIEDPEALVKTAAGTGPYLVDESIPDVSISFVRNPNYWNPDAYDFDTVTYEVYADRIAAANALKSGQVDAAQLDLGAAADVESNGLSIWEGGGEVATFIWLDRQGILKPELADVRVRQAISHAFDREAINENLNFGYGEVRSQAFIEGTPQYIEGGDDRYPYDVELAKELLAEAGYPDGFDLVIPSNPTFAGYEPVILQSLSDIGIRVTFDHFSDIGAMAEAFQSSLAYPFIFYPQGDAGWLAYLGEAGIYNQRGPADPIAADLFDRMDNGTAEDSAAAAQEFGELVLEECWYIPISRRYDLWGSIPEVTIAVGEKAAWPVSIRDFSATE